MPIPLHKCLGSEYIPNFECGICHCLAIDPQFHIGGFDQSFCHRLFCSSCISITIRNPEFQIKSVGVRSFTRCPIRSCTMEFKHPYFHGLDAIASHIYSKIKIQCERCSLVFGVHRYLVHQLNCTSQVQVGVRVTPITVDYWRQNYQRNNCLIATDMSNLNFGVVGSVADGTEIFLNFHHRGEIKAVKFVKESIREEFFEKLKDAFNLETINVSLVQVYCSKFNLSGNLSDFLGSLPIGCVMNICDSGNITDVTFEGAKFLKIGTMTIPSSVYLATTNKESSPIHNQSVESPTGDSPNSDPSIQSDTETGPDAGNYEEICLDLTIKKDQFNLRL